MMSNQVILANNSSIRLDKKRKETAASAGIANDRLEYAAAIHCTLQNLLRPLIQKLAAIAPKRTFLISIL
jgi:hypothetical protein